MRKMLISLGFSVFFIMFIFVAKNDTFFAFSLTNSPTSISKGTYGNALVVEISYSPTYLHSFLESYSNRNTLFLLTDEWIKRSPDEVKLMKLNQLNTGVLIPNNLSSEEVSLLLKRYYDTFDNDAIWASCSPSPCSTQLINLLYKKQINIVDPIITLLTQQQLKDIKEGDIVRIEVSRDNYLPLKDFQYILQKPFVSIEENLLGIKVNTQRFP